MINTEVATEIKNMFVICKGNIIETPEKYNVQAIVNCAKPTLMGSDSNVDGAIHRKIDEINNEKGYFKRKISEEFDKNMCNANNVDSVNLSESTLLCERGQTVITKGYGLCEYVIHAVGPKSDKNQSRNKKNSSSCVEMLASCYSNIFRIVKEHPDIDSIAVPVISSGNYGFDFEYAFKIGLTTLYNELLDEKNRSRELFSYFSLKKIYFVVSDVNGYYDRACKILKEYEKVFSKEHRAVARSSWESEWEFWNEIKLYDEQRGYFTIAKLVRQIILLLRIFGGVWTYLKDVRSRTDWVSRRKTVEVITLIKSGLPLLIMVLVKNYIWAGQIKTVWLTLMIYNLLDTFTYLLALMFLTDIQRPSANVIRSLILLFVNFIEVKFEIAAIYILTSSKAVGIKEAIEAVFASDEINVDYVNGMNECLSFFFLTIALSYLFNHMRQREFRTK